jgi:cell shape-determining protein MreD
MDRKRKIGLICFLWLVGILYVLLKGKWMDGLLRPQGLGLDVCTIIIAFLFSEISRKWAVAFSLSLGILTDIYSGGLRGLFAALYLAVYGTIHLGSRFLDLNGVKGQMVIVAAAVFIKYCLFFLILKSFPRDLFVAPTALWMVGLSSVANGLAAPFVFGLIHWFGLLLRGGKVGRAS